MLRALIYLQIVWVVICGLVFRGVLLFPDNMASELMIMAALLVFPVCVLVTTYRSNMAPGMKIGVLFIQACLTFAYFIAILPGVQ